MPNFGEKQFNRFKTEEKKSNQRNNIQTIFMIILCLELGAK